MYFFLNEVEAFYCRVNCGRDLQTCAQNLPRKPTILFDNKITLASIKIPLVENSAYGKTNMAMQDTSSLPYSIYASVETPNSSGKRGSCQRERKWPREKTGFP